MVTELSGHDPKGFHNVLSQAGFRRSHNVAYAPACEGCNACVPMRIVCHDFKPSRNHKRVMRDNSNLIRTVCKTIGTAEQYRLFADYQARRHTGGEMSQMTHSDYQALVEDTPVDTYLAEYREPEDGRLVAACLTDRVNDGLSAVYSFFDVLSPRTSLGTYMILSGVQEAIAEGLDYLYLGFWVENCDKMAYKSRFRPSQVYRHSTWSDFVPDDA